MLTCTKKGVLVQSFLVGRPLFFFLPLDTVNQVFLLTARRPLVLNDVLNSAGRHSLKRTLLKEPTILDVLEAEGEVFRKDAELLFHLCLSIFGIGSLILPVRLT